LPYEPKAFWEVMLVIRHVVPGVPNDRSTFKMLGHTCLLMQCCTLDNLNLQQRGCYKLGSQIYFVLGGLQFDRPAFVGAFIGILQNGHLVGLEFC